MSLPAALSDVRVQFAPPRPSSGVASPDPVVHVAGECARIHVSNVGVFDVSSGSSVTVCPEPGVDEQTLELYLRGAAAAILFRQRGYLVLHASAVEIGGGAVAFLGESGAGKSTMAAAMARLGHPLVTDDVLAVGAGGDAVTVEPWPVAVRLWPDAATALGTHVEDLARVHPGGDKRLLTVSAACARALPLRRVYVLADGEEERITLLPPSDALVELLRHAFGARSLSSHQPVRHFQQCARVAGAVAVRTLRRRRRFEALTAVTSLIQNDLEHGG